MNKTFSSITSVLFLFLFSFVFYNKAFSSEPDSLTIIGQNKLSIGGYGQIDVTKTYKENISNNATLDVHRFVVVMNYKFNKKLRLLTEIEMEHVSEVYVEQAYFNYRFSNLLNIRGGLILIPLGIVNEYHEPNTFNGVLRPITDKIIIPSTWREIGAGITGRLTNPAVKYQLFIVNGFNSYNGTATLSGTNGFRKARQKGAESIMTSPNFTGKISYYGIPQLKLNISTFIGKTESDLFNNLDKTDSEKIAQADSSIVGIGMYTGSLQYNMHGLYLRGQYSYVSISNSTEYNQFLNSDMGSAMLGYYAELGYNVFSKTKNSSELIPFIRYTFVNTHQKIEDNIQKNNVYKINRITAGIGYKITPLAMIKSDVQFVKKGNENNFTSYYLNIGLGFSF